MARSPEGPPPPPVVQRLRIHYAKRGRLRFTSHRDFQRAFERAVRRAGVPIAFSAGFRPHPRISYAGAASTGVASEAEYLEIGLAAACRPEAVRDALDASLPDGLDVIEVIEVAVGRPGGAGALADRLEASRWRIEIPGLAPADAAAAVAAFLARDEVGVERLTKDGRRSFDARGPVVSLTVLDGAGADEPGATVEPVVEPTREPVDGAAIGRAGTEAFVPDAGHRAILDLVVRHVTPAVRPDDVLTAVRSVADRVPPSTEARVTRLAQGPLGDGGRIADPLAADRSAAGAPDSVVGATPAG
ncbi:MAG: TIGR03936 family radical SAM-associated protein [Frankiaceae bacterium]